MNQEHRSAFMVAASAIKPQSLFRQYGVSLREFLHDQAKDSDSPSDIGAKILECYCVEDGRYNGFEPGVRLAIAFLDKTLSGPVDELQRQQCLKDLKSVLTDGPVTGTGLKSWVTSNYR